MSALLLYIIKSGFCLTLFYILFRWLLSSTTFFRFNRITLLTGMIVCALLPFVEVTTHEENLMYIPMQALQQVFEENEEVSVAQLTDNIGSSTQEVVVDTVSSGRLLKLLVGVYLLGFCSVFIFLLVSTWRMFQLIRSGRKQKIGAYWLIVVEQPIGSFSWGKYIVISESDCRQCSKEILLHEIMHLRNHHTIDLLFMQLFLLFHWFNPVVWLLKRDLQEIHEYEADNGVINTGIDATKYQLLLVKKAVGTRLYSMANGFNHSKLKNRITMMLKKRTSRWVHLKLLLFVPVIAGTLYAFARPEVEQALVQTVTGVQQQPEDDYLSLVDFFGEEVEAYGQKSNGKIKTDWIVTLFINRKNQILFDNRRLEQKDLKAAIVRDLSTAWEKKSKNLPRAIAYAYDRGSNKQEVEKILRIVKEAYLEVRQSIEQESTEKGKEYLDRVFPILVYEMTSKDYDKIVPEKKGGVPQETAITGITVTLIDSSNMETVLSDFTLNELKSKLLEAKAASTDSKLAVELKANKDCKMGDVTDIKEVLRSAGLLKVNPLPPLPRR